MRKIFKRVLAAAFGLIALFVVHLFIYFHFWGYEKVTLDQAKYELMNLAEMQKDWRDNYGYYASDRKELPKFDTLQMYQKQYESDGKRIAWTSGELPEAIRSKISEENLPYINRDSFRVLMWFQFRDKIYVLRRNSNEKGEVIGIYESSTMASDSIGG